jgi:DNA-binding XRE family transcriptional regulator
MRQGTASIAGSARQKGRKRQVKSWQQKHGTGGCSMTAKAKPRYVLNKKALQHYLIDHDLTQDDFAKTLGISTSYFNELMNGRKCISISNMFSIAEETHMDIRVFLEKVDE